MRACFFVEPKNNAKVTAKLKVQFGLENLSISPAGQEVDSKTMGHHHLLIDHPAIPDGEVIPTDASHLHFGKGQTETEIELTPGTHQLTLQFADGAHRSFGKAKSETITVHVK